MADTHDSKVVVVTGDVTMDWNLARAARPYQSRLAQTGETVLGRSSVVGDWGTLAGRVYPEMCRRGEAVCAYGREAVSVGPILSRPAIVCLG